MSARKFLVIVDETPECELAIIYAAKRAAKTGASVVALCIAATSEFQHWLGVENLMREEAEEEAQEMLDRVLTKMAPKLPAEPERKVVIANRIEGIRQAIAEDPAIMVLVLAAAQGSEGPGPLVSAIAGGQAGAYPVPITIVPGGLSEEEIDAIV
ncbi:universal stress protein [Acuticoccus yangtzensis]|uniref:universal stress protein n=1 Tax=Acuticoccus yangtzensis TaxID=1443441 RepID=UPI0009498C9F|nr:universal stress protein [Acuticoccus yangtzensis]ORE95265.1 Universal stress protein family [Stappia sp. 22II-S9-Z10]